MSSKSSRSTRAKKRTTKSTRATKATRSTHNTRTTKNLADTTQLEPEFEAQYAPRRQLTAGLQRYKDALDQITLKYGNNDDDHIVDFDNLSEEYENYEEYEDSE